MMCPSEDYHHEIVEITIKLLGNDDRSTLSSAEGEREARRFAGRGCFGSSIEASDRFQGTGFQNARICNSTRT